MKSQAEIYQALLNGEGVVHKNGGLIMRLSNENPIKYSFRCPEDWEIFDKFKELKEAYKDGANIEYWNEIREEWSSAKYPTWKTNIEYRIKPKPIYEYIWVIYSPNAKKYALTAYHKTEQENKDNKLTPCSKHTWIGIEKIKHSKRERKV